MVQNSPAALQDSCVRVHLASLHCIDEVKDKCMHELDLRAPTPLNENTAPLISAGAVDSVHGNNSNENPCSSEESKLDNT